MEDNYENKKLCLKAELDEIAYSNVKDLSSALFYQLYNSMEKLYQSGERYVQSSNFKQVTITQCILLGLYQEERISP
jgi:hypothetical protein